MTIQHIIDALHQVREQKPLVVNMTNYVVMNNSANALLAIGASPIMAHSQQEMAEMMSFAGALVVNIGTLDSAWITRMRHAIEQANHYQRPVILDPVGCGATKLRTETVREFSALAKRLTIRGNASEIIALAGQKSQSRGVDALDSSEQAVDAARQLIERYQANVVVSGPTDHILTDQSHITLHNGSPMMPYVTGTGCSLSALTGAFAAVGDDTGLSAAAVMGVAGELASKISQGPGSLQVNLLDTLYHLDAKALTQHLVINAH